MPFRRNPNTDPGRDNALRILYNICGATPPRELAFSDENKAKVLELYPRYKKEVGERSTALSVQSDATHLRQLAEEKCRMFVSHFFQAFNNGVARGAFKASERAYFQVDISSESVPDLTTEHNLCRTAENIINGDPKRVAGGGAVMTNPGSDEVAAVYNDYSAKIDDQSKKKTSFEKEQTDVVNMRAEADELIRDVWDEIEFKFRKDEPALMRRKAREYGVVYASRPGEPPEEATPAAEATQQTQPAK